MQIITKALRIYYKLITSIDRSKKIDQNKIKLTFKLSKIIKKQRRKRKMTNTRTLEALHTHTNSILEERYNISTTHRTYTF